MIIYKKFLRERSHNRRAASFSSWGMTIVPRSFSAFLISRRKRSDPLPSFGIGAAEADRAVVPP